MRVIIDGISKEFELLRAVSNLTIDGPGINLYLKERPNFYGFKFARIVNTEGKTMLYVQFSLSWRTDKNVLISRYEVPVGIARQIEGEVQKCKGK